MPKQYKEVGVLSKIEKKEGRLVLTFYAPSDVNKTMTRAVFPPNLPTELKPGLTYAYEVEDIPTQKDPNKFHHNIVKRDSKPVITNTGAPMKIRVQQPQSQAQAKDDYWQKKHEAEQAMQPARIRQGALNCATELTIAMLDKKLIKDKADLKQVLVTWIESAQMAEKYLLDTLEDGETGE